LAQRSRKRGRNRKPRPQSPPRRPEAPVGATTPPATDEASGDDATRGATTPGRGGATTPGRGEPTGGVTPEETPAETQPSPGKVGGWRVEPQMSRSQRRDAEVRAGLTPIEPGERPGVIVVSTIVAALIGGGNLVAWLAGVKIDGKHPAASGIFIFSAVMIADAIGMWRLWYGAVLGFMALLAIVGTIFALLLIEASNVLGVVVGLAVICGAGYLFFKLVRVLSRIQMPRYPGR